jgi:hypothetical protein
VTFLWSILESLESLRVKIPSNEVEKCATIVCEDKTPFAKAEVRMKF